MLRSPGRSSSRAIQGAHDQRVNRSLHAGSAATFSLQRRFREARVVSGCSSAEQLEISISKLLPLSGRGDHRDVKAELEKWRQQGGPVSEQLSRDAHELLAQARDAGAKCWIPPFSKEPHAGAALRFASGEIVLGWTIVEATTRLGGSPILMAVRRGLAGPVVGNSNPVVSIALFTEAGVLRAPSGTDLQMLQEIAAPNASVIFGCRSAGPYSVSLAQLYPLPFGRRDLGY